MQGLGKIDETLQNNNNNNNKPVNLGDITIKTTQNKTEGKKRNNNNNKRIVHQ